MWNLSVTYLDENYYMLDYVDDVSKTFSEILNTDMTKRFWRQSDIKNLIAKEKTCSTTLFCNCKKPLNIVLTMHKGSCSLILLQNSRLYSI